MSKLYIVRHGLCTLTANNYTDLTPENHFHGLYHPTGTRQMVMMGGYLAGEGMTSDCEVYVGDNLRCVSSNYLICKAIEEPDYTAESIEEWMKTCSINDERQKAIECSRNTENSFIDFVFCDRDILWVSRSQEISEFLQSLIYGQKIDYNSFEMILACQLETPYGMLGQGSCLELTVNSQYEKLENAKLICLAQDNIYNVSDQDSSIEILTLDSTSLDDRKALNTFLHNYYKKQSYDNTEAQALQDFMLKILSERVR